MNQNGKTWPPASGLNTPTCAHQDASLTTTGLTRISAPAALVFSIVVDTATYPDWCTFVPRVTITSQPSGVPSDSTKLEIGTAFTYHVAMDPSKPHKETPTYLRVTDISTPESPSSYIPQDVLDHDASYTSDLSMVYRISWKGDGGFFSRGLRTERFHEVIIIGEKECEVRTWESMGGPLARTVKWMYKGTLEKRFREWCEDLKTFAERKAQAS
jgi:hypothetical protein